MARSTVGLKLTDEVGSGGGTTRRREGQIQEPRRASTGLQGSEIQRELVQLETRGTMSDPWSNMPSDDAVRMHSLNPDN